MTAVEMLTAVMNLSNTRIRLICSNSSHAKIRQNIINKSYKIDVEYSAEFPYNVNIHYFYIRKEADDMKIVENGKAVCGIVLPAAPTPR